MPYNIPKEIPAQTAKMETCVADLMKQGKDKSSAIAICKASIMSKGKTKREIEENLKRDFSGHLRLLSIKEDKDKKVIRVAIVSEEQDSYDTIIKPEGLVSPLESVPVDYNHNRISTGAKIKDAGYDNLEIPDGQGGTKKTKARVVEIEVYRDSKLRTQQNKDKEESIPNAYEAVKNGRIGWVSVDFEPIKEYIEVVYNAAGEKIREVYNRWRLNFLSLLDTKPGQDTAYILNVRVKKESNSLQENKINNNKMSNQGENKRMYPDVLKNKAGELFVVTKEVEEETKEGQKKTYTAKNMQGQDVMIDGSQVGMHMSEGGSEKEYNQATLGDVILKVFGTIEQREKKYVHFFAGKDDEDKTKETPKEELKKTESEEERKANNKMSMKKEDDRECGTKREGEDKKDEKKSGDKKDEKTETTKTEEKKTEEPKEDENKKEVERLKRELKEKEDKLNKINDLHKRILNSPKVNSSESADPATDLGEGAAKEDDDSLAKQMSKERFID